MHEPNFLEAYNNLGNALREAGRADEAIQCYTLCIQLQLARPPAATPSGRNISPLPAVAAQAQSQRLSVAYNNLGGILKMQVRSTYVFPVPPPDANFVGALMWHCGQLVGARLSCIYLQAVQQ